MPRGRKFIMSVQTLYASEIPNNSRVISGTVTIKRDDVSLYCDTSTVPVIINLLQIPAGKWNTEYVVYVKDQLPGNSSVNNITVVAPTGFLINNAPTFVINSNGESAKITISTDTDYIVSSTGGSPRALTELVIARNVFVSKNGNDSTGLIERLDKPFLTYAAARAAVVTAESAYYTNAAPGQPNSIVSANDRIQINMYAGFYGEQIILLNNVDVYLNDSVINGVNSVGIMDNNVSCNSIVYGSGNILGTVYMQNSGTKFQLWASAITVGDNYAVRCDHGQMIINVPTIQNSSNLSQTIVDISGKIIINNSRIINTLNAACANGGDTILITNNCTLITSGGHCAEANIYVYGACQSNKPVAAGFGCIQHISSILIDPNVI